MGGLEGWLLGCCIYSLGGQWPRRTATKALEFAVILNQLLIIPELVDVGADNTAYALKLSLLRDSRRGLSSQLYFTGFFGPLGHRQMVDEVLWLRMH